MCVKKSFVIKGNICQTPRADRLDLHENAFAVCVDGVSRGVFEVLPEEYAGLPLYDYGDSYNEYDLFGKNEKRCFASSAALDACRANGARGLSWIG